MKYDDNERFEIYDHANTLNSHIIRLLYEINLQELSMDIIGDRMIDIFNEYRQLCGVVFKTGEFKDSIVIDLINRYRCENKSYITNS